MVQRWNHSSTKMQMNGSSQQCYWRPIASCMEMIWSCSLPSCADSSFSSLTSRSFTDFKDWSHSATPQQAHGISNTNDW